MDDLVGVIEEFIDAKIAFTRMSPDQRRLFNKPLNDKRAKLRAALATPSVDRSS